MAETKRAAKTPRLSGRALALAVRVVKSGAGGPLRRWLGAALVDKKLEGLDLAAEGDPPPFYMPARWERKE